LKLPNNKVDFDDHLKTYDSDLASRTRFFSSNEDYFAAYKIDVVRRELIRPPRYILEFGCGIGRNIPHLRRHFPQAHIVGTDIAKASLEVARKKNPDVEFVDDAGMTKFGGAFDLIFVASVFHHVPPARRVDVSKRLFGWACASANLFVFEHNPFNPVTRYIVNHCPYDEDAVLLKPSELTCHLEEANFVVVRKAYCLVFPPALSTLARIEPFFGGLPFGGQYWLQARRKA
jgi:SAM-dependent methyltransferase